MSWRQNRKKNNGSSAVNQVRIKVLAIFFVIFALIILGRLFDLQILRGHFFVALASGQHELYRKLFPERGSIYVREQGGKLFPLVTNKTEPMLYAIPKDIENPQETAEALFDIFGLPENVDFEKIKEELFADISPELDPKLAQEIKDKRKADWLEEKKVSEIERLAQILGKENDPYEPLFRRLSQDQYDKIEALNNQGLAFKEEVWRFYPEEGIGGHIFGFWGFKGEDRQGSYGLEGYFNKLLSGEFGEIYSERDAWGNFIALGQHSLKEKKDGADLVLTIDRAIQYKTCQAIYQAVEYFKADSGSVIVIDPKTGAILAMCGAPDFNPDKYNKVEDASDYNNPTIFKAYEPGSIFKPITIAAALDQDKINPFTTYVDTGSITIGPDTIKNFESKSYGRQTMTEVLEKSINTGVIYAMRQISPKVFGQYVKDFGFGQAYGISLDSELAGDISNLDRKGEIYAATASFGQGITATPLQIVNAIGAVANGGKLMKPYIVSEIIHHNGENLESEYFYPEIIRQVVSPKTATMLSGMLVSVIENGHGQAAKISGYRVAGKTGTAQVANKSRSGYSDQVITSFVGFAPFSDPKFAMIVRIDNPGWAKTGASSAAPVFSDIAKFILQYYNVPYDAPIN